MDDIIISYGIIPNIIKGPSKRIVQNCFPEYHKFIDELKKFDPRRIYKSDLIREIRSMTYIIVGGSAGLGRAIAKKFASEKNDLIIISSDIRDTKALASDLEIRYGVNVVPLQMSLSKNSITFKEVDEALENLSAISRVDSSNRI